MLGTIVQTICFFGNIKFVFLHRKSNFLIGGQKIVCKIAEISSATAPGSLVYHWTAVQLKCNQSNKRKLFHALSFTRELIRAQIKALQSSQLRNFRWNFT